jgi:uncharacterized membrane protein YeiH
MPEAYKSIRTALSVGIWSVPGSKKAADIKEGLLLAGLLSLVPGVFCRALRESH